MLKLQLLDRRFFEGNRVKRALLACLVLTVLLVGGLIYRTGLLKSRRDDIKNQATVAQGFDAQVTAKQGEIDAVNAEVAPFDAQLAYMKSLRDYGDNFPERLQWLSRYIYNRAEVLTAVVDANGFNLQVRTKTTADVAGLMINLKQGYKAGLIAQDSVSIQGLTGWPNPTSPRGWGPDTRRRIDIQIPNESLQAVNSGSAAPTGGSSPVAGSSFGNEGPGMSGSPMMSGSGSPMMSGGGGSMSPPMPGSGGMSGAPPMASGGGGGGQMATAGGLRSLQGLDLATAQFFSDPQSAAHRTYIKPSDEPPMQPYLNLAIAGRWAVPFPPPVAGGAGAGMGGPGMGMGMGMGGVSSMSGPPGMSGPPSAGSTGYEAPPGTPMGGPGGSGR